MMEMMKNLMILIEIEELGEDLEDVVVMIGEEGEEKRRGERRGFCKCPGGHSNAEGARWMIPITANFSIQAQSHSNFLP